MLRRSKNRWAERIVTRRGFRRVAEFTERDAGYDVKAISAALTAAGLEHFAVESRGVLSKYFSEGKDPSLFVIDVSSGRLTPISDYTPLYQRYASAVKLSRVYVRPDQADAARPLGALEQRGQPAVVAGDPGDDARRLGPGRDPGGHAEGLAERGAPGRARAATMRSAQGGSCRSQASSRRRRAARRGGVSSRPPVRWSQPWAR